MATHWQPQQQFTHTAATRLHVTPSYPGGRRDTLATRRWRKISLKLSKSASPVRLHNGRGERSLRRARLRCAVICAALSWWALSATLASAPARAPDSTLAFQRVSNRQALSYCAGAMTAPRFPPQWTVEETAPCFIVRDHNKQALAFVYCEDEPGRRTTGKLLTPDEARRREATKEWLQRREFELDKESPPLAPPAPPSNKGGASERLVGQDREPNLDLIESRGARRRNAQCHSDPRDCVPRSLSLGGASSLRSALTRNVEAGLAKVEP
jgi:hypothetical protein